MGEDLSAEHSDEPPTGGRRRWSLLSHLLALVLAVAAITVSAGAYLTVEGYRDARRRASAQLRETVDLAARGVRQDLEQAAAEAQAAAPGLGLALATAAATGVPLSQGCQLTFSPRAVFAQGDQHLLDAAGSVSCTSREGALGTSYRRELWFTSLAGGAPVVAAEDRDPATGVPAAVVGIAIPGPDGGPVGYSLSVLAAQPVAATLEEIYGRATGSAFVVADRSGRTLSSSSAPASTGRPAPRVAEGQATRDADGTERIYSATRVPALGWRVLGAVSRSAALAPAREEVRRRAVITAMSLLALLLLAVAVHRRLLRPVQALSDVVTRARSERGMQAPATGPAELAGLAVDLNAMLAARDAAEAELAASAHALGQSGRLVVEATEQERHQMGSRLHDGPIQDMILTSWALDDVAAQLPPGTLAEVRRRLEGAIASSRAIEADLRPPKLAESGLSQAVAELLDRRRADGPLEIELLDHLQDARFPAHTELLVYRSVQAAIQSLGHPARPSRITVSLRSEDGTLSAVITDDGADGDDRLGERTPAGGSSRAASLRDTITLAGGRLDVASGPDTGREIRIELPVTAGGDT